MEYGNAMQPRRVLIIHPSVSRRSQLRALLREHEVVEAATREEALKRLPQLSPSVVLSHHLEFRKLLRDLERHAPKAVRAVLCPMTNEEARRNLVDVAAEGHQFVTLDDTTSFAAPAIRALVQPRACCRFLPLENLQVRFHVAGAPFRGELLDVGTDGLGLRLPPHAPVDKLLPGTLLEELTILRGSDVLLSRAEAVVRTARPAPEGVGMQLGVVLPQPRRQSLPTENVVSDRVRIHALLRRAARSGATFSVRTVDRERPLQFDGLELAGSSLQLIRPVSPPREAFLEGDPVEFDFELCGYAFHASTFVQADGPMLALPRTLRQFQRRSSLRIHPSPERSYRLSFTSPLTGDRVDRPLLDLHAAGFGFPFDPMAEVLPPGMFLPNVRLTMPDGRGVPCRAQVQSSGGSLHDGNSEPEWSRRCGARFVELEAGDRQALLDELIANRCPEVQDGSVFPFRQIWELFESAQVKFPDYPHRDEAAIQVLEQAHQTTGDGRHGLTKSLVYRQPDGLHGHTSGLRIYSKTWLSQHLVARPGYHRHDFISHELVNLMVDYAEALPDVEFLRGLWRTYNRWTVRVYGAIVAKMQRPGLSCLSSFTPCRIPLSQLQRTDSKLRVRPAEADDKRLLLEHARRHFDLVELLSSDLVEGELELEGLSRRYAQAGLQRRRWIDVVDGDDGPLCIALREEITPGLFWAEWYGAVRLLPIGRVNGAALDEARRALIFSAAQSAQRAGRSVVECLASDEDLPCLEAMGFSNLGKVMEWTIHRSMAREWSDRLNTVFERASRRQERSSSSPSVEPGE